MPGGCAKRPVRTAQALGQGRETRTVAKGAERTRRAAVDPEGVAFQPRGPGRAHFARVVVHVIKLTERTALARVVARGALEFPGDALRAGGGRFGAPLAGGAEDDGVARLRVNREIAVPDAHVFFVQSEVWVIEPEGVALGDGEAVPHAQLLPDVGEIEALAVIGFTKLGLMPLDAGRDRRVRDRTVAHVVGAVAFQGPGNDELVVAVAVGQPAVIAVNDNGRAAPGIVTLCCRVNKVEHDRHALVNLQHGGNAPVQAVVYVPIDQFQEVVLRGRLAHVQEAKVRRADATVAAGALNRSGLRRVFAGHARRAPGCIFKRAAGAGRAVAIPARRPDTAIRCACGGRGTPDGGLRIGRARLARRRQRRRKLLGKRVGFARRALPDPRCVHPIRPRGAWHAREPGKHPRLRRVKVPGVALTGIP